MNELNDERRAGRRFAGARGSAAATPRFQKAYLECLDDTGAITRLEPLYGFAKQMELENRALREGCSKIATSIGNGSAASPNASVDFLTNALASEVKLYCAAQRAEIEYLREQVKRAAAQPNEPSSPTAAGGNGGAERNDGKH